MQISLLIYITQSQNWWYLTVYSVQTNVIRHWHGRIKSMSKYKKEQTHKKEKKSIAKTSINFFFLLANILSKYKVVCLQSPGCQSSHSAHIITCFVTLTKHPPWISGRAVHDIPSLCKNWSLASSPKGDGPSARHLWYVTIDKSPVWRATCSGTVTCHLT